MKITLKTPTVVDVSDSLIDDIVSGAFEGGINYWVATTKVTNDGGILYQYGSEVVSKGGNVGLEIEDLKHAEAESDKKLEYNDGLVILRKTHIIAGLIRYLEETGGMYVENGKISDFALDADSYDAIIQYGLFGKLIFG